MRIRRLVVVVGFLLTPAVASADGHRWDLFGGLSFAEGSWLTGFHLSGEHILSKHVFATGDYSWHDGSGFKRQVFGGGVNVSKDAGKASFSGRLLLGGVTEGAGTDFAWTVGSGVEFGLPQIGTARQQSPHWVGHLQVDYVNRNGESEGFWRVSLGAKVRFPRKP
jgi:hypothetical protein